MLIVTENYIDAHSFFHYNCVRIPETQENPSKCSTVQKSAFTCSLYPEGVGSCFCTVSSLICVTTHKCFDVARKSDRKIIKFMSQFVLVKPSVDSLSVQQSVAFQKYLYVSNANTVRSNKLQTGFNLLMRLRTQLKHRVPLWRVRADSCCRNAQVDLNEVKMEMCISVGIRRNSRTKRTISSSKIEECAVSVKTSRPAL